MAIPTIKISSMRVTINSPIINLLIGNPIPLCFPRLCDSKGLTTAGLEIFVGAFTGGVEAASEDACLCDLFDSHGSDPAITYSLGSGKY